MSRYTSKNKENLSEKKMSASTKQKLKALFMAGIITAVTLGSGAGDMIRGEMDSSNDLKEYHMPNAISYGSPGQPNYSKFIAENREELQTIKQDLDRYQELKRMAKHSDIQEAEIDELENKIINEYGKKIEKYSLATAKAKLADAHNMLPHNISVKGSASEKIFVAYNNETDKVLLKQDSKLVMSDALMRLVMLQNNSPDNDFAKSKHANRLTLLFGKTLEMGSKTYKLSKSNELLEIDYKEQTVNKSDDYER